MLCTCTFSLRAGTCCRWTSACWKRISLHHECLGKNFLIYLMSPILIDSMFAPRGGIQKENGLPHILFSIWSNALLPPGTTKWSTSHLVVSLVTCFATARYHRMVHLTSCCQFGQKLCYRQVPQNGPPHILLSIS